MFKVKLPFNLMLIATVAGVLSGCNTCVDWAKTCPSSIEENQKYNLKTQKTVEKRNEEIKLLNEKIRNVNKQFEKDGDVQKRDKALKEINSEINRINNLY